MNQEEIRDYVLKKADVTEGFPFGEGTLVFKTKNKIFLLLSLDATPLQFNVKCNPEKAEELREMYGSIKPGYHMNKKHWNTVVVDGEVPQNLILEMIDHSYQLVSSSKK